MLIGRNGTRLSAKGLSYTGAALDYGNGVILLDATLEAFSTAGETLRGPGFPNVRRSSLPLCLCLCFYFSLSLALSSCALACVRSPASSTRAPAPAALPCPALATARPPCAF